MSRWLTRAPATLEDYRTQFEDEDRLTTTLVVQRGSEVIGDLMLQVDDAWAQTEPTASRPSWDGSWTPTTSATAMPPRPSPR